MTEHYAPTGVTASRPTKDDFAFERIDRAQYAL
jgi:hypothetical protein